MTTRIGQTSTSKSAPAAAVEAPPKCASPPSMKNSVTSMHAAATPTYRQAPGCP